MSVMDNRNTVKGWKYCVIALLAFAGLGLEVLIGLVIEPVLYGVQMGEWNTWQNIIHWIITCIVWGIVTYFLIRYSKKKYEFDLFKKAEPMKMWQWIAVAACIAFSLVVSFMDWNGSKVLKEFYYNGWLKFIFQYIYYMFETALFMLIIVFGQKAFEKWFQSDKIPYGGIAVALTWGLVHTFTKGSIASGLISALGGFLFGVVYLLVNRDIKKTYLLLLIMFVL